MDLFYALRMSCFMPSESDKYYTPQAQKKMCEYIFLKKAQKYFI